MRGRQGAGYCTALPTDLVQTSRPGVTPCRPKGCLGDLRTIERAQNKLPNPAALLRQMLGCNCQSSHGGGGMGIAVLSFLVPHELLWKLPGGGGHLPCRTGIQLTGHLAGAQSCSSWIFHIQALATLGKLPKTLATIAEPGARRCSVDGPYSAWL